MKDPRPRDEAAKLCNASGRGNGTGSMSSISAERYLTNLDLELGREYRNAWERMLCRKLDR